MEDLVEKLTNTLNVARGSWPITIQGSIENKDGTFTYNLTDPLTFDAKAQHVVYLSSFTGWSNFPNVVKGQNNKFVFSNPRAEVKTIVFGTSLHSVDSYNRYIHQQLKVLGEVQQDATVYPITLSADVATQRVSLSVKKGYKIYFDSDTTWRDRLGFESREYGEGEHEAPKRADIVKTLNIFIEADICYGWSRKGNKTNTIYAIVNNEPAGNMLIEKPNPPIKVVLNKNNINSVNLKFLSDDGEPITFQGEEFILTLIIERL